MQKKVTDMAATQITPLDAWIRASTGLRELNGAALREYHLQKLRSVLRYVKEKSRFYKDRLQAYDDIHSQEEFSELPFTFPSDIAADPYAFLCVPPDHISRIVTLHTSGTTGSDKRVMFTSDDQELTIGFFTNGMATFTAPGDNVMLFMPGVTPGGVGNLLARGLSRLSAHCRIYGPISDYDDASRALLEFKPDVIVGLPSQMLRLAAETSGSFRAKSVLLASDYMSPALVRAIGSSWNCEVFTHYGLTETGLGGAVTCCAHDGYHMRENDLYFEIIDAASGLPVPDGESGEICVTTFNHSGMPLIRYRTGDISRMLTRRCPCSSALRRLDNIEGRIDEPLLLRSGQSLSIRTLDDIIFRCKGVTSYSARLTNSSDTGGGSDANSSGSNGTDVSCGSSSSSSNRGCNDLEQETLVIELLLKGSRGAAHEPPVIPELSSLPVRVELHLGEPDFFTSGAAKRCIADMRVKASG